MHPDRAIERVASHQYGVLSLEQAKTAGLTQRMVDGRVERGAWIRLASGVYAVASAPPKWERQMAAALLSRPGSIAAGASAAYLHRLEGFGPGRPVIAVPVSANARTPLGRVIRTKYFDSLLRDRIAGFEVTDLAETILGVAGATTTDHLERILDDGLASRRLAIDDLAALIDERSRVPGIKSLRGLVLERSDDAYEPPVSELERTLHKVIRHRSIPAATRQMPFEFDRVRMTVDVYIPAWKVIVEADGRRWHTREADFERDRRRDNSATAHGLAVLRFTYRMLRDDPGGCLAQLIQTGRRRTPS